MGYMWGVANDRDSSQLTQPSGQFWQRSATSSPTRPLSSRGPQVRVAEALQDSQTAIRWHSSAADVGVLSADGHIFEKDYAEVRRSEEGYQLSTLTMLYEVNLHTSGMRCYEYSILRGQIGLADGVGFVFDTSVRRMNIQKMRSIYINRNGQVCVRDRGEIRKLWGSVPKLAAGMTVWVIVDLDVGTIQFQAKSSTGRHFSTEEIPIASCVQQGRRLPLSSGFFCAVVTHRVAVSLH